MLIAQISDTHLTLDTPDANRRADDLARTIADINTLDPLPDVIVHTGDVVHNGLAEEYALARKLLEPARPPVYVSAGNKDHRDNLRAAFLPHGYLDAGSDFITYTLEGHSVRLAVLDTLDPNSNKGDFCTRRASDLSARLSADTKTPTAIFAHHPPFQINVGPEPWNFGSDKAMARLTDALRAAPNVVGFFCGHVHRSTSGQIGDISAVVIPSVATPLRWGDYPEAMQTRPTYFLHQYDPAQGFSTSTRIV